MGEESAVNLLVFLGPELLCAIIKELLIHLHEKLQSVVDEAVDGPVDTHTEGSTSRSRVKALQKTRSITVKVDFVAQQLTFLYISIMD